MCAAGTVDSRASTHVSVLLWHIAMAVAFSVQLLLAVSAFDQFELERRNLRAGRQRAKKLPDPARAQILSLAVSDSQSLARATCFDQGCSGLRNAILPSSGVSEGQIEILEARMATSSRWDLLQSLGCPADGPTRAGARASGLFSRGMSDMWSFLDLEISLVQSQGVQKSASSNDTADQYDVDQVSRCRIAEARPYHCTGGSRTAFEAAIRRRKP